MGNTKLIARKPFLAESQSPSLAYSDRKFAAVKHLCLIQRSGMALSRLSSTITHTPVPPAAAL